MLTAVRLEHPEPAAQFAPFATGNAMRENK